MQRESGVPQLETEARKFVVQELKTKDELTQFFLVLHSNNPFFSGNNDEERRVLASYTAQRYLNYPAVKNQNYHFFGVSDGDKVVGVGQLVISQEKDNLVKQGYLCNLEVLPQYRGKNLATMLTLAQIECAKQNGCDLVECHVDEDNPVGAVTKFKDGFILADMDHNQFKFSKRINSEESFDRKNGPVGELKEVPFSDLDAIKKYLIYGWVGIDIKNIEDKTDNSRKNWIMIMEKSSYENKKS